MHTSKTETQKTSINRNLSSFFFIQQKKTIQKQQRLHIIFFCLPAFAQPTCNPPQPEKPKNKHQRVLLVVVVLYILVLLQLTIKNKQK
jgi:hypothetical protein